MSEDAPGAAERVRDAILRQAAPRTAAEIADVAGVDHAAAATCLAQLAEAGTVLVDDGGGAPAYYPDPVATYLERLGPAVAAATDADAVGAVRAAVREWMPFAAVGSPADLARYRQGAHLVASSRLPAGPHVYDADWDVLVVLDTCRVDALRTVAGEYGLLTAADVEARVSRGSQTAEWLAATFTHERAAAVERTGYVAGNGWVTGVFADGLRPDDDLDFDAAGLPTDWAVVDADRFGALVEAWRLGPGEYSRDTPWDPHPSPRTVTDQAIGLARERGLDRLVVHYKQPHAPYTERARQAGRTELTLAEASPRGFIEEGGDPGVVWDAYLTDLRAAMAEVAVLCENVDGRVAITADHGEAFGEDGALGHRPAMLHPTVKEVPWATVQATDEGTREGTLEAADDGDGDRDGDLDDHLAALGYR